MRDVEAAENRDAPLVRPKFRSRSEPVRGPRRRTEPVKGRRRLSRRKESQVLRGNLFPVVVETPELWEEVEDLRRERQTEEAPDEGSLELDMRHKEVAVVAGNR